MGFRVDKKFLPTPSVTKRNPKDDFISTYKLVDKIQKTGDGDEDFVIKKVIVEVDKKNRSDYINSYGNDVGVLNILKKVQATGDLSLMAQYGATPSDEVNDLTIYPQTKMEAFNVIDAAYEAYQNLDPDLKGKMTLGKFVESFTQEKFDAYIKAHTPKVEVPKPQEGE